MTVDDFKAQLAILVDERRNREAMSFAVEYLSTVQGTMALADRMMVADWMEGVDMALDVGADAPSAGVPAPSRDIATPA